MEGIENMEGVMAIGVGYVVILTPGDHRVFGVARPTKCPRKATGCLGTDVSNFG
jgi:hypothetical protein